MLFQYSVIHLWYKVDRIRGHWAQEIQWQGQKIHVSPIYGIQTVLGPIFISATIKVCDFKFGTQLRLDEYYAKNNKTFRTKLSSVWAWQHLKNFGIPYLFLQLLKLAT